MLKKVQPIIFWLFMAAYGALSVAILERYAIGSNLGDSWRGATLERMVDGTAERPYIYRALVPLMTRMALEATPEHIRHGLDQTLWQWATDLAPVKLVAGQKRLLRQAMENPEGFYARMIVLLIVYGFLWLYMMSLYQLAGHLWPDSAFFALLAPIIGLLLVPPLMVPLAYLYDIPGMGLAAACYYCLAARRWRWFWLWFALACTNKETAIFMTLFSAVWFFTRMERQRYILLITAQLALFAAVRGFIYWRFMDNPGVFLVTSPISRQLAMLVNGYDYETFLIALALAFVLLYRWAEKPAFAKYGLVPLIAMSVAYLLFGRFGELRVFLDILPLPALLITHTLAAAAGLNRASPRCIPKNPQSTGPA